MLSANKLNDDIFAAYRYEGRSIFNDQHHSEKSKKIIRILWNKCSKIALQVKQTAVLLKHLNQIHWVIFQCPRVTTNVTIKLKERERKRKGLRVVQVDSILATLQSHVWCANV